MLSLKARMINGDCLTTRYTPASFTGKIIRTAVFSYGLMFITLVNLRPHFSEHLLENIAKHKYSNSVTFPLLFSFTSDPCPSPCWRSTSTKTSSRRPSSPSVIRCLAWGSWCHGSPELTGARWPMLWDTCTAWPVSTGWQGWPPVTWPLSGRPTSSGQTTRIVCVTAGCRRLLSRRSSCISRRFSWRLTLRLSRQGAAWQRRISPRKWALTRQWPGQRASNQRPRRGGWSGLYRVSALSRPRGRRLLTLTGGCRDHGSRVGEFISRGTDHWTVRTPRGTVRFVSPFCSLFAFVFSCATHAVSICPLCFHSIGQRLKSLYANVCYFKQLYFNWTLEPELNNIIRLEPGRIETST